MRRLQKGEVQVGMLVEYTRDGIPYKDVVAHVYSTGDDGFKLEDGTIFPWSQWEYVPVYLSKTFEEPTQTGAIKSDGGSSSYYDLEIPEWLVDKILERKTEEDKFYIKTEECCEVFFGNDFDYSNLFKSSVRSYGSEQGKGKSGNNVAYEMNKVQYSANKIKELSERRSLDE